MIELSNVTEGDCFTHSIVGLFGRCSSIEPSRISVLDDKGACISWPIIRGRFKAFVNLQHGRNDIELKTDSCTLRLSLFRTSLPKEPSDGLSNKLVRVLYVVCADDANYIDENSIELGMNRVDLGLKLIQSFMSEAILTRFETRKTFALKSDLIRDGFESTHRQDVRACELFRSNLKHSEALSMSQNELFIYLAQEIRNRQDVFDSNHKYVAVLSFTKYEKTSNSTSTSAELSYEDVKGHCALGAEWLAVYGTPCLHTWADRLENLERCFSDLTTIDESVHFNDSGYRNTNWACYSTTLGSLMHEFSHIVNLGHNLSGIMARGFDDLANFFTLKSSVESCWCYSQIKNSKNREGLIEKIVTVSNERRDTDSKSYQKVVKRYADFVDLSRLKDENLPKEVKVIYQGCYFDELVYDLCCHKIDFSSNSSTSNEKAGFCTCTGNCRYLEPNLMILFNHKWLNNVYVNDLVSKSHARPPSTQSRFDLFTSDHLEVRSSNRLVYCELRTLKSLFTFAWQTPEPTSAEMSDGFGYSIDFDWVNSKLEAFRAEYRLRNRKELGAEETSDSTGTCDQFELLLVDSAGVIWQRRVKLADRRAETKPRAS